MTVERDESATDVVAAVAALHGLSSRALEAPSVTDVLDALLDATMAVHRADVGEVRLYDPTTRTMVTVVQRGTRAASHDAERATPLMSASGERLGMLSTHVRTPRRFTEAEEQLTELLAREVSRLIERLRAEREQRESDVRARRQTESLQALVDGEPLARALTALSRMVVTETGGEARTAFYLANPEGTKLHPIRGAGDMPDAYLDLVDGFPIGPESLACGLAVPTGSAVITRDVFDEPRWTPWTHIAQQHDYRGCWSFPIRTREDRAVGTFAMYFREPRDITPRERSLAEAVTRTAGVVVASHELAEERARAEGARRESEAKYSAAFAAMDDGFCIVEIVQDAQGEVEDLVFRETNRAFSLQSGLVDVTDRSLKELLPTLEAHWIATYERVARTGVPERVESHVKDLDRWFSAYFSRVGDEGSLHLAVLFRDITERKRAEAALKESEAQHAFLLRLSDALRPLTDPVEVQAIVTRMLGEHLGASRVLYAEMIDGKEVVVHRDHAHFGPSMVGIHPWETLVGEQMQRDFDAGRPFVVHDTTTDPRLGRERAGYVGFGILACIGRGLKKGGKRVAMMGVHASTPRQWTERELSLVEEVAERTWSEVQRAHTEAAQRESEAKYRSLFTAIDEGFCILELLTDAEGAPADVRYLETNPAFERQARFAMPAAGRTFAEITGRPPEPAWLDFHAGVVASGGSGHLDGYLDATGRWYEVSATRLGGPGTRRLACVFKDITERKRVERLMQQALEREQAARAIAEEATALRDEFLGVVSHELRTPLSAILIWGKALRSAAVPPARVEEALDAIIVSASAQHSLVEELLDMSRLSAGKMQISVLDDDVGAVVEEALAILRPTAVSRGVELRAEGLGSPVRALIDRGRLHQVLWNVIGNALKFTPAGGHVAVRLSSTAEHVVVEVVDDGCGIDGRFLPHLFDRFRQADMSPTRSAGGLGLGLAIARQVVEVHGGTITAASEGLGRGATFRIELPRGAIGIHADRQSTPVTPSRALAGRRILLVEDESHTRAVLEWLLESSGAEVVAVARASAARDAVEFGGRFDMLVCDLGLPQEDGCSLLEALRRAPGPPMPAMALTAYVRQQDRDRARDAGFETFMTKPITPALFLEAVAALCEPTQP